MSQNFRIAVGKCNSSSIIPKLISVEMVKHVLAKLENIRTLNVEQINQFQESSTEVVRLTKKPFELTVIKKDLEENNILIVVQGYRPTIVFPNYFSLQSVGHLVAEGIIFGPNGQMCEAPDELLWEYR